MTQNKPGGRAETAALICVVVGALALAAALSLGAMSKRRARPPAQARWTRIEPQVIQRLAQAAPPEFGAVWMTRQGLICGVVNGKFSFGGKTGMTPFYAGADNRPVFFYDLDKLAFAKTWRDCQASDWLTLKAGSKMTGYCATQDGAKRCRMVG